MLCLACRRSFASKESPDKSCKANTYFSQAFKDIVMEMDPSSVDSYFVICIFLVLKNPTNKLNMHFHFVWSFWQTVSKDYQSRFIDRRKTERGGRLLWFTAKATPWKQSLQPTSATPNHNSHKHNWNFIECKTTGSIQVFRNCYLGSKELTFQSHEEDIRPLAPLYFLRSRPLSPCAVWDPEKHFPMVRCVPHCPQSVLMDAFS